MNAADLITYLRRQGASPPPSYTRDGICLAPSRFGGGVIATTTQLGTVPSWGPEIGMLTSAADRVATYRAHYAAGARLIYASLYAHYTEGGVSYPNNTAANNDWTVNNFSPAAAWCNEVLENNLIPALQLGGDELGTAYLMANAQKIVAALGGVPCALVPTFDSDSDGDWSDPGDNWAGVNLAFRAAMPKSMALFNWLPNGWARLGTASLSGAQVQTAEACVDAWVSEWPDEPGQFLAPWPAIQPGSAWDAAHGVYQPNYAGDPSNWTQFVQIIARRARAGRWNPPRDEPFNVPGGLGIGGPQNGQPVTVSADARYPQTYTFDTARGITYYRGDEIWTYPWTHQGWPFVPSVNPAQIDAIRAGLLACGVDATG